MTPTTYAEINLIAYKHNLRTFQAHVGNLVGIMAMVKANAYGHGAIEISQAALQAGAKYLGIARVTEGITLRQAGIDAPIVAVYYSTPEETTLAADFDITPTLNNIETAQQLSTRAVELGKTQPFHMMIDTGMGTFGQLPHEAVDFLRSLQTFPALTLEGVFTHFATADASDTTFTGHQLEVFQQTLRQIEQAGFNIPLRYASNSPATLYHPDAHLNLVRLGISSYGLKASSEMPFPLPLEPILTLKSHVGRVREFEAGASFGYGQTYIAEQPVKVALIPVGYGDGYHRIISNRGAVLIRGQRAPIIGRISMDQLTVDVTHINGVQEHEEVVLIGKQGDAEITAEEVATWAETINYEVVTSLLDRVKRVYREE